MIHLIANLYRWMKTTIVDTKGFQRTLQVFLVVMLLALANNRASAQLGRYAFAGTAACPNTAISVTTQPANATFGTYTSTGTACSASNANFLTSNWTTNSTFNVNEYNQFTITPSTGYVLTLTNLSFKHAVSVNGTTTTTWYLRSSLDNYAANIATGSATTANQTANINLPS